MLNDYFYRDSQYTRYHHYTYSLGLIASNYEAFLYTQCAFK